MVYDYLHQTKCISDWSEFWSRVQRPRPPCNCYAAFGSDCKYYKYDLLSWKFRLVHLPTRIYYSETHCFQQHGDNSDFATLTFVMAPAADELFRLTIISWQKIVRNIAKIC